MRGSSSSPKVELPDGVVVSVQGISRAPAAPPPDVPRWLKKVLPKSGLAGKGAIGRDMDDADDPDDELVDGFGAEERAPLHELSFELRPGEGLGILGGGSEVGTLMRILIGGLPPTTGRIVVRGKIAHLLRSDMMRYVSKETGREAVMLIARYLHWPRSVLRARFDEILEFARLDELDKSLSAQKYRNLTNMRLLFSAALHMDAALYVLDHGIQDDYEFGLRCFDLIEQRKREGAAVIQGAQKMVEDVARLCDRVLFFEGGHVVYDGRPVDVALSIAKLKKDKVHPLSVPVAAAVADGGKRADVGPGGAPIEIELHLMRKELFLGFVLELTDDLGHVTRLESPGRAEAGLPGVYRLRIFVPTGRLEAGTYAAKLLGEISPGGAEPGPPRELLAFDVVSSGRVAVDDDDSEPQFELVPYPADDLEETEDVGWSVSRAAP